MASEVVARIKKILISELGIIPSIVDACDPDTPLLGRGIGLDSVEILALVAGIEKEFDIQVDDDDLTVDLFKDIGTLRAYILQKMVEQKGQEARR